MQRFPISIGTICILALQACAPQNSYNTLNNLYNDLVEMPIPELEELAAQGHIGAAYRLSYKDCGNKDENKLCNLELSRLSNSGHPLAMGTLSLRMTFEGMGIYNLKDSYMWTRTKMHFVQPMELSESDFVRSYQLLDQHGDIRLIEYLEGILTDEEIAQAKAEADMLAPELWAKLQEYCKTWKEEDYVCWYEYTDTPNEERIE